MIQHHSPHLGSSFSLPQLLALLAPALPLRFVSAPPPCAVANVAAPRIRVLCCCCKPESPSISSTRPWQASLCRSEGLAVWCRKRGNLGGCPSSAKPSEAPLQGRVDCLSAGSWCGGGAVDCPVLQVWCGSGSGGWDVCAVLGRPAARLVAQEEVRRGRCAVFVWVEEWWGEAGRCLLFG